MKQEFDIYEGEERIVRETEQFLSSKDTANFVFANRQLIKLTNEYKKLLKETKRLVRMSDKREKDIKRLNDEMTDKNKLLALLSRKLSRYVSPQIAEKIFTGGQDVVLESKRKKLTVFFSDIVGFTEIADRLESEDLTNYLNYYLDEMTKIALEYGATVDKYMGDAIMIFFGDPVSNGVKEDALVCVKMAVAMRKRLNEIRKESTIKDIKAFHVRMGIATGYCTVGNFGSEERMDYTVIGNSVNTASRLESAAGIDEILISQETYDLVHNDIKCEERGFLSLKGLTHPVQTYSVIDIAENTKANQFIFDTQIYGGGVALFVDFDKITEKEKKETLLRLYGLAKRLEEEHYPKDLEHN